MVRNLAIGLVLAFAVIAPAPAQAQVWDDISGTYLRGSSGSPCEVQRVGNLYLFTNENGAQAYFQVVDPVRGVLALRSHDGGWFDRMFVTVRRGFSGRVRLYFECPDRPGYRDVWRSEF